jgi:hypothetical protein
VRLHRFLRGQIENNFLWADLWVLKGALIGLPNAFDNNLRYFWRYLKINSSESLYSMRATARFVIPASAPVDTKSTVHRPFFNASEHLKPRLLHGSAVRLKVLSLAFLEKIGSSH